MTDVPESAEPEPDTEPDTKPDTEPDTKPDTKPDDQAANASLVAHFHEIFLSPELDKRGEDPQNYPIGKALIILRPGEPVRILLNDEFELVAQVRSTRAIAANEAVTSADIAELHLPKPDPVEGDDGWAVLVNFPDGRQFLRFDFRRNLRIGNQLLDLADDYVASARADLESHRIGPSLDAAFTAAELAVSAMMHTTLQAEGRSRGMHDRRVGWLKNFTSLDNAPVTYHQAMSRLRKERSSYRYGDPPLTIADNEAADLVGTVEELVTHARLRLHADDGPLERVPDEALTTFNAIWDPSEPDEPAGS